MAKVDFLHTQNIIGFNFSLLVTIEFALNRVLLFHFI